MNADAWLDGNNRYLGASLQWLRLRLAHAAAENEPAARASLGAIGTSGPGFIQRWMGTRSATSQAPPLSLEDHRPSVAMQIEHAAAERAAAAAIDPPPALVLLAQRLGLSAFERDILLLCAAMELDPGVAACCACVNGNPARNYPTFGLALSVFDDPAWDALSAQRPLRYARLLEISQPGALPLTASPLRADERIVEFLKGLNVLDDRLATLAQPASMGQDAALAASQQAVVETILQRLHDAAAESIVPIVQLVGTDAGSKLAVAQQSCAALNRSLYRIGADALPSSVAELETFARLWQRESLLLPIALYIDANGGDANMADDTAALHRLLSRDVGLVLVGVRDAPLRLNGAVVAVDVDKPSAAEQREAWTVALHKRAPDAVSSQTGARLAGQFSLNLRDIHAAATAALRAPGSDESLSERLWDSCRALTRPRLDALALCLDAKATWDDLVLPDEAMSQLRQIAAHVRERHRVYGDWGFAQKMNRGLGISALFTGESGTGKTMAAEVIANDLRLNVYRIDLSAVVSKYIGETEKNLRKLFDAAEQGGAILLFDEADALFGKRSEVKDSHDRYANIEINYLLQRMEAFSGLAILASNMKNALDPAFMRRLRFIVPFPFPGVKERARMWQQALPPKTPRADLDYDRLARLNLSGGNINSIALNAAFLAAQNGQTVTMPILLSATRTELRKLNKPVNEAEIR